MKIELKCKHCGNLYKKSKSACNDPKTKNEYCSLKCLGLETRDRIFCNCSNCNAKLIKHPSVLKNSKTGNLFCSRSCSATYNNKHKTNGNRRSKLELYLQEQLNLLFPNLEIHYNRKDAINSELDIHIPSLKLAFELNGIFHYEPIYGQGKLDQIQNNDHRKFSACAENGISLCIIDTSSQKYFKEQTAKKFFEIIINKIYEES